MKIRVEWTTPEDMFSKEFSSYRKALDYFTKIRDGEEFWSTIEMWRLDKDKPELMAIEEKDNYEIMKHIKENEKLDLDEELSDDIEKFINDIYELRKNSIASEGEYGLGNLVFKEFRNRGYLDNLKELRKIEKGKELSLEGLEEDVEEDKASKVYGTLDMGATFDLPSLDKIVKKNIYIVPIESKNWDDGKPSEEEFKLVFDELFAKYKDKDSDEFVLGTYHDEESNRYSLDINIILDAHDLTTALSKVDNTQQAIGYIDDNGNYQSISNPKYLKK